MEACCELRSEFRDDGRKGVVGLEGIRVREADRERWRVGMVASGVLEAMISGLGVVC